MSSLYEAAGQNETLMSFEVIEAALNATLLAQSGDKFAVEGFPRESHGAEEIHANPHVTAFYNSGSFPKGAGGRLVAQHDMSFRVEIAVATDTKVDLGALTDPNTTPQARMSALAAQQNAAPRANALWNRTMRLVYQILRDPRYVDLGLSMISNQWLDGAQKDAPASLGEYVLLTGSVTFTCRAPETTLGVTKPELKDLASIDTSFSETTDPAADLTLASSVDQVAQSGAKVGS